MIIMRWLISPVKFSCWAHSASIGCHFQLIRSRDKSMHRHTQLIRSLGKGMPHDIQLIRSHDKSMLIGPLCKSMPHHTQLIRSRDKSMQRHNQLIRSRAKSMSVTPSCSDHSTAACPDKSSGADHAAHNASFFGKNMAPKCSDQVASQSHDALVPSIRTVPSTPELFESPPTSSLNTRTLRITTTKFPQHQNCSNHHHQVPSTPELFESPPTSYLNTRTDRITTTKLSQH